MGINVKDLKPGTKIPFCYAAEYDGPNDWRIAAEQYQFIQDSKEPRYTITNGVTTVENVRSKDMYEAAQ